MKNLPQVFLISSVIGQVIFLLYFIIRFFKKFNNKAKLDISIIWVIVILIGMQTGFDIRNIFVSVTIAGLGTLFIILDIVYYRRFRRYL